MCEVMENGKLVPCPKLTLAPRVAEAEAGLTRTVVPRFALANP